MEFRPTHLGRHRRTTLDLTFRMMPAIVAACVVMTLAACGSSDPEGADRPARTISIRASEFRFEGDGGISITAGESITFDVRNTGELIHELQVLDADGQRLGQTGEIPPGAKREVTVRFESPGVYQVICDIDDHLSLGQRAQFEVTDG